MARAVQEVITPSTTDDLPEGTTNKYDTGVPPADLDAVADGVTYKKMSATEQTKLGGIEESATADQTGSEIQTALDGLADNARKVVMSDPQTGEFKIYGIHRNAAGNLEIDYETVAS